MVGFFKHAKEQMLKEGVDEAAFDGMFSGIKGVVLLDTCGDAVKLRADLERAGIPLKVLETRKVGLGGVQSVLSDAIDRACGIN